ncbi:MAG: hypothetical protein DPW09_23050 [Anaerolineae bacterium]|nr:hypothetical protein [Anaerolineales bacterium]MCQ3976317.1 hypothetical protein [Anaerolineae bacterium]
MSNKTKEIIVDVTQDEYQADLARGLEDDEVLRPGRHKFNRGGFLTRHGLNPEDAAVDSTQVRIVINLDLDVFNYFKQRAAQNQAESYDAQINQTLRAVMEHEQKLTTLSND